MNSREQTRLQKRLAYTFRNPDLLEEALTHKSFMNETKKKTLKDNERLEFLGDAVLDLIICQTLMEQFPDVPEGDLSKMKAKIVNEDTLAQIAQAMDLGAFLLLGKGEERTQGSEKPSLLANALEAVIAAIYLDAGLEASRDVILNHFKLSLKAVVPGEILFDYKTALQEYSQKRFGTLPVYCLVNESGPDHQKRFEIETWVEGKACGLGMGKSKKAAEQQSAETALAFLQGKE
ncbi:ribonuclease III [Nitrospira defluvii]|nr:ribonuclease III [Nitrospira defluvii]